MKNYEIILHNKNSFKSTKLNTIFLISIFILFILFGYIIGVLTNSFDKKPSIIEKIVYSEKHLFEKYNEPFSQHKLKQLLIKLNVKHIDIVLKQAAIESSHFKSKVFVENNNLFGMRLPQNRITTAIGSNLNHANYETWQDSVIDYAIYQSTYLKNKSRNEYLAYLRANYAENISYVELINKM